MLTLTVSVFLFGCRTRRIRRDGPYFPRRPKNTTWSGWRSGKWTAIITMYCTILSAALPLLILYVRNSNASYAKPMTANPITKQDWKHGRLIGCGTRWLQVLCLLGPTRPPSWQQADGKALRR